MLILFTLCDSAKWMVDHLHNMYVNNIRTSRFIIGLKRAYKSNKN